MSIPWGWEWTAQQWTAVATCAAAVGTIGSLWSLAVTNRRNGEADAWKQAQEVKPSQVGGMFLLQNDSYATIRDVRYFRGGDDGSTLDELPIGQLRPGTSFDAPGLTFAQFDMVSWRDAGGLRWNLFPEQLQRGSRFQSLQRKSRSRK